MDQGQPETSRSVPVQADGAVIPQNGGKSKGILPAAGSPPYRKKCGASGRQNARAPEQILARK